MNWPKYTSSGQRRLPHNLKYFNHLIILLLLLGTINPSYAQESEDRIDLESFAERLFQVQDENIAYEDLYESLLLLYTHPIDLNKASKTDLEALYILNPVQVSELLDYIENQGPLISIYELQTLSSLDVNLIRQLVPFVTIEEKEDSQSLWSRIAAEPNKYFIYRMRRTLEKEQGFTDEEFLGDQNQMYGRFRASRKNDFSFGFTFEKDIGEALTFNKSKKGFDFYSFHAMLENIGFFHKIIIGDFQAQFGQGLVFGSGFSPGKGSETINSVRRSSTGIRPYTSVLESGFFRGVGLTHETSIFKFSLLYSNLGQDANLISDTTYSDFDEFANSIQSTGLHRTEREAGAQNILNEQSGGIVIFLSPNRNFDAGFTSLYSSFSIPIQKKPNNYNQFEFKGSENFLYSTFFNANWQNFTFFGEAAQSSSKGTAVVSGLVTSLSPKVDLSFVFRNYDRNFHTFYGNGFGEGSRVINEAGTYWGLKIKPNRRNELSIYYDRFAFPWLRFRAEAPSSGFEYLIRWMYQPTRSITLFAQFRQENKERTIAIESGVLNQLALGRKRNYILNADYKINKQLSLKTRIQWSDFSLNGPSTKGFVILQDLNFNFWKMKISGRMAIVDTDDFENRQYIYERNVLYAFSTPAIAGLGIRRYLLLQYNINRNIGLWVRGAQTLFQDAASIISGEVGSGLNTIEGNTRTELTLQARVKF